MSNLIIVDDSKQVAGGQYSLLQLLKCLAFNEYKLLVKSERLYNFFIKNECNVYLKSSISIYLVTIIENSNKPTIFHVNTWRSFLIFAIFNGLIKNKVIFRMRSAPRPWVKYIAWIIDKKSVAILCNSQFMKNFIDPYFSKSNISVIYNYHGVKDAPDCSINSKFVMNCIARISRRKNQIFLLDVIENLLNSSENLNLELNFYGETSGLNKEKKYISNFLKKVEVLNKRPFSNINVRGSAEMKVIYSCSLVLIPHRNEPLGRTLLESYALNKHVLLLPEGGNTEVFSKKEYPLAHYEPHNVENWANQIDSLYKEWCKNSLKVSNVYYIPKKFSYESTVIKEREYISNF
jgi:glycosyltransferase involved in cell wall biosynthesis